MTLGKAEIKILAQLQQEGRMTNQELADKVGMSACRHRPAGEWCASWKATALFRATVPC